jgi:origin recognition complex subunit 4
MLLLQIPIVSMVLSGRIEFIPVPRTVDAVMTQIEHAGWGLQNAKLKGLPQPCLGILVIAKHLHYAGREEFNFEMVKEEYERFGRVRLVGSGKVRWPIGVLKTVSRLSSARPQCDLLIQVVRDLNTC